MASRAVAAVAASSSSTPFARLISRRRLAAGADHHGPAKVNLWEDPMNPARWKEEHFVLASLSGWGLLIYGGFKLFGGKKENKAEAAPASTQ